MSAAWTRRTIDATAAPPADTRRATVRTVADLMHAPVITARSDESLDRAAEAMVRGGVGSVVVVGDPGCCRSAS